MSRPLWHGYPLLFALVPLLSLVAHNPGEYEHWDLATIAIALLLVFGAVLALLWLALRDRLPPGTPAVLALVAVAWFYGYVPLHNLRWGVALATLATLVGLVSLARARPGLTDFARFMTCMGLILLGWSALLIGRQVVRQRAAVRRNPLLHSLAQSIPINPVRQGRTGSARDIYLIVLDEYAAAPVLREQLGFDNHAFEDSLRSLGFTIPEVRSNYGETMLSIPSLLNFAHVTALEPDFRANPGDPEIALYLVTHNRAARFLKEQGYTYVLLSGWHGTRSSPYADVVLRPGHRSLGVQELDRTELRHEFLALTILGAFFPPGLPSDQTVLRGFELLKEIPRWEAPTFTLAHFMLPHHPYRFNSTCGPSIAPRDPQRGSSEDRLGYRDQLECTNRQVLALVHALLERSSPSPIILLQGDHGSRMVEDYATVGDSLFRAQVRERFAAFGAYYLPDGGDTLFTGRVSVVNVLRNALVHYFGADLRRQPDSAYFFHKPTGRFIPADSGQTLAR